MAFKICFTWGPHNPSLKTRHVQHPNHNNTPNGQMLLTFLCLQLLVVSPLTRAIQTADIAYASYQGPILVEPLARERVWLSSDCGRSPAELAKDFPSGRWDYNQMASGIFSDYVPRCIDLTTLFWSTFSDRCISNGTILGAYHPLQIWTSTLDVFG